MRWLLAAAVVLTAVAVYFVAHSDAPRDERRRFEVAGPTKDDAGSKPTPTLAARPKGAPLPAEGEALLGATTPNISAEPEGKTGAETAPPTRKLRPGETFAPVTALKVPSKEGRKAAAEKTRALLSGAKPLRTTWSDAPLQDVLRQLSNETGLVLALGPEALDRGMKIRVSDPLGDADPAVDLNVWNILEALARRHGFALSPWEKGVLLREIPDPTKMRLRYYDLKDLVQADWGNAAGIPAEDRLAAVLPTLIRGAANIEPDSTIELRHGVMIARQTTAAHERIGQALETWRAKPERLRQDYRMLISKRHPTVSGAPPRAGEDDAAGDDSR